MSGTLNMTRMRSRRKSGERPRPIFGWLHRVGRIRSGDVVSLRLHFSFATLKRLCMFRHILIHLFFRLVFALRHRRFAPRQRLVQIDIVANSNIILKRLRAFAAFRFDRKTRSKFVIEITGSIIRLAIKWFRWAAHLADFLQ